MMPDYALNAHMWTLQIQLWEGWRNNFSAVCGHLSPQQNADTQITCFVVILEGNTQDSFQKFDTIYKITR